MSLKQNWATGDSFGATDLNSIAGAVNALGFNAQAAYVATSESTTSTTYADLTTTTDSVTVTIGSSGMAFVTLSCWMDNTTASAADYASFAASGANTIAANDNEAYVGHSSIWSAGSYTLLLTGLSQGTTTFKMKYRVDQGTGTFKYRRIAVIPFP